MTEEVCGYVGYRDDLAEMYCGKLPHVGGFHGNWKWRRVEPVEDPERKPAAPFTDEQIWGEP